MSLHWLMSIIVVVTLYVAVCVFAAYMTYREHQDIGQKSVVLKGVSYAVCAVWPLMVPFAFLYARWHRSRLGQAEID